MANVALQGQWMWRYMKEEDKLWKSIVEARWGRIDDGGARREVVRLHGIGLWRKILIFFF